MSPLPRRRTGPLSSALRLGAACLATLGLAGGCALFASPPEDPIGAARDERIAALEAGIQIDRDALVEMVARSRDVDREPLHEDTELRTIADRLRARTAELARLRAAAESERTRVAPGETR